MRDFSGLNASDFPSPLNAAQQIELMPSFTLH
jgi:hypothetical protein